MKIRMLKRHDLYLVIIAFVFSLIVSLPFILRLAAIMPAYLSTEARGQALDAIFLLREEYGLTIGDLTLREIRVEPDGTYITISEDYHARRVDRDEYDDLHMDYVIRAWDGRMNVTQIIKRQA